MTSRRTSQFLLLVLLAWMQSTRSGAAYLHVRGEDKAERLGGHQKSASYAYVRLPKTGSSSYRRDLVAWDAEQQSPALASGSSFFYEIANPDYLAGAQRNGEQLLLLLREPTAMVLSMFKHCVTKELEQQKKGATDLMSLETWLRGWHAAAFGKQGVTLADVQPLLEACSFIPVNPATSCLSSKSCSPGSNLDLWHSRGAKGQPKKHGVQLDARWVSPARLEAALNIVHTARAVGILEHYAVSLCVALQSMHKQQLIPQCDCARGPPTVTVIDHNTSSIPPALLAMQGSSRALLANLTSDDRELYAAASKRFHNAAEKVELKWGKPLLGCANFSNAKVDGRHLSHGSDK